MIRTKRELAKALAERDHCTFNESYHRVLCTQQIIDDCIENCTLEDIEDILADHLGIELDYLHIFIM